MPCHPAICFNPHLEFCPHNPEDIREGKPFLPKKNFPQQGLCEDQQNTTSEAHQQQNQNIVLKKQEKYTHDELFPRHRSENVQSVTS